MMPELAAQTLHDRRRFIDATTAELDAEARAQAAKRVIELPAGEGRSRCSSQASSRRMPARERLRRATGCSRITRSTDASMSTTVRTPDGTGSGWAAAGARDWSDIDPAALGTLAAQKARGVAEPVGDRARACTRSCSSRRPSPISSRCSAARSTRARRMKAAARSRSESGGTKIGEKIADERVTIYIRSDRPRTCSRRRSTRRACRSAARVDRERHPEEPRVLALLGAEAGQAADRWRPVVIRRRRRLRGRPQDGGRHEDASTSSSRHARGMLVTHFFYIRFLDPANRAADRPHARRHVPRSRTERSRSALKNFRWNESPLFMLNKIEEIGRAERTSAGW